MRVALAQIAPAWLQREATLEKIAARLEEAAGQGAQLAVFGEALLPGYPFWLDYANNMGIWDYPPTKAVFRRLFENSVEVPGPAIERLGVPAYNWWNEGLHGVGRAGVATVFPQAIGLAAFVFVGHFTLALANPRPRLTAPAIGTA